MASDLLRALDEADKAEERNARRSAARAKPSRDPETWGEYGSGLARSVGQGLTFGFGDELAANARYYLGDEDYDAALEDERKSLSDFSERHPFQAVGAEVVGALPTMFVPGGVVARGASALGRGAGALGAMARGVGAVASNPIGRGALSGALTGGAYGFGTGEGGVGNRLANAGTGAVLGGGIGGALPAVIGAARGAGRYALTRSGMSPARSAEAGQNAVLRALERSDMAPDDLLTAANRDAALGVPSMVADQSPALTRLAETVATIPGKESDNLIAGLESRWSGMNPPPNEIAPPAQRQRVFSQIAKAVGAKGSYYQKADELLANLRRDASPFYERAYNTPIPAEAQVALEQLMPRIPKSAIDYANELMQRQGVKSKQILARVADDGTVKFERIPDMRQWDYIQRALRDISDGEKSVLTGGRKGLGQATADLRNEVTGILDNAVDDFRMARSVYRDDASVLEALRRGREEFLGMDPEGMARELKRMSTAEREVFRVGALDAIRKKLFAPVNQNNAARLTGHAGDGLSDMRLKIQQLYTDPGQAAIAEAALLREAQIAANTGQIARNSRTAARLAGREDLEGGGIMGSILEGSIPALTGNLKGSFLSLLQAVPSLVSRYGRFNEDMAGEVARILRTGKPGDVRKVVEALNAAAQRRAKAAATSASRAGAIGTLGSAAVEAARRPLEIEVRKPPQRYAGGGKVIKEIVDTGFQKLDDITGLDAQKLVGGTPYDAPAGSDPRYVGAAPDRTEFSYLRHVAPKGTKARTLDAIAALRENRNGMRDQLLADVEAGKKLDGSDWYNTEELRDWFTSVHGEEEGDKQWREFIGLIGATSPGMPVPENIKIASMYRHKGPEWTLEHGPAIVEGTEKPLPGYGSVTQKNQARNAVRYYEGQYAPDGSERKLNMKPKGFTQSLLGSGRNIAADMHFTRWMAMASGSPDWLENGAEVSGALTNRLLEQYGDAVAPYLKVRDVKGKPQPTFDAQRAVKDGVVKMEDIADEPRVFAQMPDDNEYDAFEKYVNELAGELGMTGPQLQANLWMGAGSRTGLHEGSKGTFMDLLKKRADDRAKQLGLKPKFDEATGQYISPRAQVLDEFIRNRGLLEMGGAMGGLGAAAKYATDLPPQEQESPIPRSPVY